MKIAGATLHTRQAGFTMVEIAIAIAVIGFALVAIIGVLPTGLQVQRDNREETIITQDGLCWLEAVRSGATNLFDLPSYVYWADTPANSNLSAAQIISRFCDTNPPPPNSPGIKIHAISSPVIDRASDIAFNYFVTPTVVEVPWATNLVEVRLSFHWPVVGETTWGSGKRVLRTVINGRIERTNGLFRLIPGV